MEKLFKTREAQKGFTLIEILVVIGIIAILAAIVLIAINPAKQFRDANDTQRSANVNAIVNAVGQFMVDNNGTLPSDMPAGGAAAELIDDNDDNFCTDLVPTFIPALPVDPTATTTAATEDGQVSSDECDEAFDTGYTMEVDNDGRVTIAAPLTQSSTTTISVTR
jgi:type IV pilus assembly protein PilA